MPPFSPNQKPKRRLPLPTMAERDAMIGQTFWPNSSGKGLGPLSQQGRRKLHAITLADKQEGATLPEVAFSAAKNDANKTSTRSIEDNDAVIGKTFWPTSTGKDTLTRANHVQAREQAAKSAPDRQAATPKPDQQQAMRDQDNAIGGILTDGKDWIAKQANEAAGWANSKLAGIRHDLMHGPIDDTLDASARYMFGDGSEQELSDDVKSQYMNHKNILWQIEKLKNGTDSGDTRVDFNFEKTLSSDTFHIGRTKVYYNEVCEGGVCTTTFRGPYLNQKSEADGFENPLYIGVEPGKPYKYKQFEWQVSYPDPRQTKQKK